MENCYLLPDVEAELSGPGDDTALACLVSSQDEVGGSQHLGLGQTVLGLLIAGEIERDREGIGEWHERKLS